MKLLYINKKKYLTFKIYFFLQSLFYEISWENTIYNSINNVHKKMYIHICNINTTIYIIYVGTIIQNIYILFSKGK